MGARAGIQVAECSNKGRSGCRCPQASQRISTGTEHRVGIIAGKGGDKGGG